MLNLTVLYYIGAFILLCFVWFHATNPFIKHPIFKNPYKTFVRSNGEIGYERTYKLRVYAGPVANLGGYIKSGFLIVQNTFFGFKHARGKTAPEIISDIHRQRFDPNRPYLISGDQFAVLYPRNLGVFYNQLLNPNTALDQTDWENRQRIYLQSVLLAIDGLSASHNPRTTIIPIGTRHAVLTQVHPGGIGSDQVFGLFYALNDMHSTTTSDDGAFVLQTESAVDQILQDHATELQFIYDSYISAVYEPETALVRKDLHLSSARDGVIRSSSLYDNIIMYETIKLAKSLGLKDSLGINIRAIEKNIKSAYWNEANGYYNDDVVNHHFSADWLIGFVTGFFDLNDLSDLKRTILTIEYIEASDLARPFPIKYQVGGNTKIPRMVKWFVPNYGAEVIWSYWGSQYIALLAEVYKKTSDKTYLTKAKRYIKQYENNIRRDAGFAETFDTEGEFLKATLYKSIRVTGWVVEFEYAKYLVKKYS